MRAEEGIRQTKELRRLTSLPVDGVTEQEYIIAVVAQRAGIKSNVEAALMPLRKARARLAAIELMEPDAVRLLAIATALRELKAAEGAMDLLNKEVLAMSQTINTNAKIIDTNVRLTELLSREWEPKDGILRMIGFRIERSRASPAPEGWGRG